MAFNNSHPSSKRGAEKRGIKKESVLKMLGLRSCGAGGLQIKQRAWLSVILSFGQRRFHSAHCQCDMFTICLGPVLGLALVLGSHITKDSLEKQPMHIYTKSTHRHTHIYIDAFWYWDSGVVPELLDCFDMFVALTAAASRARLIEYHAAALCVSQPSACLMA